MNNKTQYGASLDINNGIATITLNRPKKRNAFDDQVIESLRSHLATLNNEPGARLLVLRAEGKHFCAGADLDWMRRMAELSEAENKKDAENLASLLYELNSLPIPSIAMVQGAAFGGAVGLIACCDIALCADDCRFSLSEVKLGLSPATISPYVIAAMGERNCRRLFLTAEVFDARQANDYGLIHEVGTASELPNVLDSFVSAIMKNGPKAMGATKELIAKVASKPNHDELFNYTSELIARLRVSDEGQEGISAFFDKRAASWVLPSDQK